MALRYDKESGHIKGTIKSPMSGDKLTIDNDLTGFTEADLTSLQISAYVMVGGGMLGSFAMRQPGDFYIDDRVGRLPYAKRDIYQVVEVLKGLAIKLGKDPHNLPEPRVCGAWVF